jgi:predicted nucleotide-binding protein
MLEEVQDYIVKNSRPLMQMRISKKRKEFGNDPPALMEKEAHDNTVDLKAPTKNILYVTSKKTLNIGLQAAHQMKRIQTQTYFGRSVNKSTMYDPADFQKKVEKKEVISDEDIKKAKVTQEKLDKFIDRVAFQVETALQSNEIINVFQDDFEMLGDSEAA